MRASVEFDLAEPADYQSFADLFPELGVQDPIPSRERWLREIAPTTIIARRNGEVCGYAYYHLLTHTAYVRQIVVAQSFRGQHIGGEIMSELRRRFRECGVARWCLNVKPDNVPAVRLYRSVGMSRAYGSTVVNLFWDSVARLPDAVEAETMEVNPSEDAKIELAFDLPRGQIANSRARPGRVPLWISDRERPVAFADFDPSFPGAFPFKVHRNDLARALLEGMRLHRKQDLPHLRLVIEGNSSLSQLLVEVGAQVITEIDHYQGFLA